MSKFVTILAVRTAEGCLRQLQGKGHNYRIDNDTKAGPLKRPLRLDQALAIVDAWDEDVNEGRSALVSIDDAAIAALRSYAGRA